MNCSICLEDFNNSEIFTTTCNHKFCIGCITRWVHINKSCPLCRTSINNIPIHHVVIPNKSPYDENGNLINRRQNYLDLYMDGNLQYEELLNGAQNFAR